MAMELIRWDIYEIKTQSTAIHGVMLRGRIRRFGLENDMNILAENASDLENVVRFAIPSGEDGAAIIHYLNNILPDVSVDLVSKSISNPVLSKLKVNIEDRYTL